MIVLGIDPGSVCGWCYLASGAPLREGTTTGFWHLTPGRGDSPGVRFLRLQAELNRLEQAIGQGKIQLVVYEQQHHRGGAATAIAAGLVATLQMWCAARNIDFKAVHSATLKKYATGSGRAEKEAMVAKAREALARVLTPDEADAFWLMRYGLTEVLNVVLPAEVP